MGETQVDGDAAPLLLLEPVGVDPRQGLHQRRFAVVNVPGCAHHNGFHLQKS